MHNVMKVGGVHGTNLKVAVLGLGHVGLPTALGFAELGWNVTGSDQDVERVRLLKAGKAPFYEPGLHPLLLKHLTNKRFTLTAEVESAVRDSNVLFVCVGTPQRESGEADLTQIELLARLISRNLNGYKLIIEKSTVPAVTAQWVKRTIALHAAAFVRSNGTEGWPEGLRPDDASTPPEDLFEVASNPEFLQEGKAIEDFFRPDRVILGVESERSREILETLYRPLKRPMVVTNLTTAELIKHAANAFLSTKISFINMVADVCEAVGADVAKVSEGLGLDPRIGSQFLSAGIGFGGYCFPKDLRAFVHLAEEHSVDARLLKEVERINQHRVGIFLKKLRQALWVVQGKNIAVLGLSFKPETDDIREAPSLAIVKSLLDDGANLRLYDPQAMPNVKQLFPESPGRIVYCSSPQEACVGAHAVAILTDWDEFRQLDLRRLREVVELPILVDGRNLFELGIVKDAGFEYISIGRASVRPAVASPALQGTLPVPGLNYASATRS